MKKIIFITFILTILKTQIFSYPYVNDTKQKLDNGVQVVKCSTEGNYDSNTKVTFYGDSRIEYAEFPLPYGLAAKPFFDLPSSGIGGLDTFLGALPEGWNVQNFSHSGMTSGSYFTNGISEWGNEDSSKPKVEVGISGLYNHLLNCLRANGDPYPPFPKAYKIARNVAFHIGGNDFIRYAPLITFLPWKFDKVKNLVLNNYEKIISIFIRRKRNVLVIGHYPTVAYSFYLGSPIDYYDNNELFSSPPLHRVYKVKLFDFGGKLLKILYSKETFLELNQVEKEDFFGYLKEVFEWPRKIVAAYSGGSLKMITCSLFSGMIELFQTELKFCRKLLFDLKGELWILKGIEKAKDIFGQASIRRPETSIQRAYFIWVYTNAKEGLASTIPSLGMLSVELELPEIVERRNKDAQNYGVNINYLRLWEYFLNPHTQETWVANPLLMGDRWHPNIYGFLLWGYLVGNKIRELGWHLDKFDVELQQVKKEDPKPLLTNTELNSIDDSQSLPNEISDRPSNPELSAWDIIVLCYLLRICK